jgi:uncharacterized protein YjgD (DUF1641 family)
MDETTMNDRLDAINRKLEFIMEEIELQRRQRKEMDDLKEDLVRVGKDMYQTALVELEDVHDYLKTGDIMYLGKKVLRNVNTVSGMFEQMESLRDFLKDAAPLARESFIDFMNKLDEFDRKGYFAFMKELGKVADRIVTSFSPEDVKHLGDNIVIILNTVKNMTQPDMLHAVNNALAVYKKMDTEVHDDVSLLTLMKELNTPEARRGMVVMIRFLKSVAKHNGASPQHEQGEHYVNN